MDSKKGKTGGANLLWLLIKNRMIAQLGINVFRYEKDKHKRNSKIATAGAILICLIMVAGYSGAMAYGYASLGLTRLIPGIALVISSLITLFFTMLKAKAELFGYRDYDRIMSLPIPVGTIINSRLLNMYIWNTFYTILVMVPMGTVYVIFVKPSFSFYYLWIAGILLACLIPVTIAAVLGAAITAFSTKFRYANAISTILSIVMIIAVVAFPMAIPMGDNSPGQLFDSKTGDLNGEAFSALAPLVSDAINRVYPPAGLFTQGISDGKILSFLLFAGISIGCYALFVFLLSIRYRQLCTALTSHRNRADYKLEALSQESMRFALYKKTIMRIIKSTICATNLLVGCIMAIILSAAMVIVGPEKVMASVEVQDYMPYVKGAACYVIAAIVAMTNTSAVSLSLEGRNIWIIKSLPIPPKTLYDSYLLTNLSFTVPTSLLCSVLVSISLKTSLIETAIMILTPLTFSLFTAVAGIFIGNRMAYYNWQDEVQLVKQSMVSATGLFGGSLVIIACGAIANLGILPVSPNLITFIFNILFLVLSAVIYTNESRRPVR